MIDPIRKIKKKGVHPHPNWLCIGFRQHSLDNNRRYRKLNENNVVLTTPNTKEEIKQALLKTR